MSNQSYLCCSNHPDIYPAHGYAEFDPELHTLASGVYCVPLTWLAFFSADSLVTRTFSVHGDEVVATAPISSRELCLDRFSTQLARLTQLIAIPGEVLDDYGRFLRLALENAEGEFVTIELDEIACMGDEAKFYHNLLIVLLALGGKEKLGARDACLSFGDLDLSRRILPASGFFARGGAAKEDYRNHECLIGSRHLRPVPWEERIAGS